jgi:glycogen(starch) synthase
MMERVLTDDSLRGRLVAEAREHIRGFGWPGVAREMVGLYSGACGARV